MTPSVLLFTSVINTHSRAPHYSTGSAESKLQWAMGFELTKSKEKYTHISGREACQDSNAHREGMTRT
jgi:hypothetical protein